MPIIGKRERFEMPDASRAFPDVRRALRQFKRGKLDRAAALLAETREGPWHERSFRLGMISDDAPLEPLDEWCRYEPTCPDAWLMRGIRRAHWAWEARGSGRASTVDEDMWQVFHQRLESGESDLLWAAELSPEDPEPYNCLITMAMGLSHGAGVVRRHLQQALARDPEHYSAYASATYALTEKWSGSHDQMFEVAREAAGRASAGNDLAGVLIDAHVECWAYIRTFDEDAEGAREYLAGREVRREVAELFDRTLASSHYQPRRQSHRAWNNAAFWFWLTRDKKRLVLSLERIGKAFKEGPWHYYGHPARAIAAARRMAAE